MERGATFSECLGKVRSHGFDFKPVNSATMIKESVLVRDILQMLQGFSSASFQWNSDEQTFRMAKRLRVSHLSESSLTCVLFRFMHASTCLQRVECFVKMFQPTFVTRGQRLDTSSEIYPTLQAFANAVSLRLKALRNVVLDMELESLKVQEKRNFTLMGLIASLSRVCAGAEFLLQTINGAIPPGTVEGHVSAVELATYILDYLYGKLNEFCLILDGEDQRYQTLLLIFIGTLRPMIDSLDAWLYEGILSDPFEELFFRSNNTSAVDHPTFWEKGYIMRQRGPENLSSDAPICPVFFLSMAKAIISAGKSVQLLRNAQVNDVSVRSYALRNSLLRSYEQLVSSAIWVPFMTSKSLTDTQHDHHSAEDDVIQTPKKDSQHCVSLFEKFCMDLVNILGYYSVKSEVDLSLLLPIGCEPDVSSVESLQKKIECKKSELFEGPICSLDKNNKHRDNSSVQQATSRTETSMESQIKPINLSDMGISFKPQNPAFALSAKDILRQKNVWDVELNLSRCSLLPSLGDECLRKAIYSDCETSAIYMSRPAEADEAEHCEQDLRQGEDLLDHEFQVSKGTNYAHGLGLGMSTTYVVYKELKELDQVYPYPTLLPRVQETSLVSELLPSERRSSLASHILDWVQNIKLKSTPLPSVLLQECLIRFIKDQVEHVGEKILTTLMEEWRLMDELAILRAIYLFGSGDLLQQFCDMLFNKLDRGEPWDDYYELNTMLQESIRSSADGTILPSLDSLIATITSQSDGTKEQRVGSIPLHLLGRGHGFGIDTLDSLWFTYKVSWPLELIVNQVAIKKYNQVMGILLKVKRAKFALDKARRWMWKKGGMPHAKRHLLLQQKLSHFVNTFHQYVMDRVLCTSWIDLCQGMASAASLDEVIACHEVYLASIQRQCFVAPDKLWALIANRVKTILALALDFCNIQRTLCSGGAASAIKSRCQMEVDRVGRQFDECIVFLLRVLSSKLNVGHFPHLVDLVTRINYNYYYMSESGRLLTSLSLTRE